MDHGEIVEKGTYNDLMKLNGRFADLMKKVIMIIFSILLKLLILNIIARRKTRGRTI